ncbi:hypothetical protein J4234_02315 [Candidatus Woesearchaeota archaeon]|nr:hypothetical protein [Candidatus Woesearchaeota archaeon]
MEKKEANAMEMAAQANEKREKTEEAAQVWVKINIFLDFIIGTNTKFILI